MTDRAAPTDAELKGRLRTLLAERAATVDGPPPALPDVARTRPLDAPVAPLPTAGGRRGRWLAAVAAAVVGALALGALVATRDRTDDGHQVVTTAPTLEGAGLPAAFDVDTALPVFRVERTTSARVVARSYLVWRLTDAGEGALDLADDLVLEPGTREGAIVPVRWRRRGDEQDRGTVLVRIGVRGSEVVAATTPGVDLRGIEPSGRIIVGRVTTTEPVPPGEVRVDVLPRGRVVADFGDRRLGPDGPIRYGSTAEGDEPFRVDTHGEGADIAVRIGDDRTEAISELHLDAPDPDAPDLSKMTPEEVLRQLDPPAPDPRCDAATAANLANMDTLFPNGTGTATPERAATDPFGLAGQETPAAAVSALGDALGVPLRLSTTAATGGAATAIGANVGEVAVTVFAGEAEGGWSTWEAATPAACPINGRGNLGAASAPDPKTVLHLSVRAGTVEGRAWYRTADGTTWTVALDADDFARGTIAVSGDPADVTAMAVVGRDAAGTPILVSLTSF